MPYAVISAFYFMLYFILKKGLNIYFLNFF